MALCIEAVERAASPCLSETERWQVDEARDVPRRFDRVNDPAVYGTEQTLADALRGMLALRSMTG